MAENVIVIVIVIVCNHHPQFAISLQSETCFNAPA